MEEGAEENTCPEEGGWRKLHNEELRNFDFSQNIIRMTKPNRVKEGEACNMHLSNMKCVHNYGLKTRRAVDHLQDLGEGGTIALN